MPLKHICLNFAVKIEDGAIKHDPQNLFPLFHVLHSNLKEKKKGVIFKEGSTITNIKEQILSTGWSTRKFQEIKGRKPLNLSTKLM